MTGTSAVTTVELIERLISLRAFDTVMSEQQAGWHSSRGEEGVVAGAFSCAGPTDVIASHYRSGSLAALMRGQTYEEVIEGILGSPAGSSRGIWRGDIIGALSPTLLGHMSGSLGTPIAYAVGAGLAIKQRREPRIVIATVGDGSMNSGVVLESLNLAALYGVPIVVVCQDNQYATSLRSSDMVRGDIAQRASSLGLDSLVVDGNDVVSVAETVGRAAEIARNDLRPSFVHAVTYRVEGHWIGDPEVYRTREEVNEWIGRDPLSRLEQNLLSSALIADGYVKSSLEEEKGKITAILQREKLRVDSHVWTPVPKLAFAPEEVRA